jgi:hypothetical protein
MLSHWRWSNGGEAEEATGPTSLRKKQWQGRATRIPRSGLVHLRLCAVEHKRHNWTFLGSDRGGKTMAVLRSFVASCELVGVDPFVWFRDVLSRVANHSIQQLDLLLPHRWTETRS